MIGSAWFRIALAIGPLAIGAARAHADDGQDEAQPVDLRMIAAEELAVFFPPAFWYWRTPNHQAIDFDLHWDWESWEDKLTLEKVRFDTNPFYINAIRHPLKGVLDYQITRTNGVGMLGSTVFAAVMGIAWEYVIEYREDPSINDMIFNTSGGIAIGEPLWEIGQLWRGGQLSAADRVRTALVSPFDALHDAIRGPHRWWRPRVWRSFVFEGGVASRHFAEGSRGELTLGADLELVADPSYVLQGARSKALRPGAWNRFQLIGRFADASTDHALTASVLHSRTSLVARYRQDGEGNSALLALGSAFTYRKERLWNEWDKLAIAHLLGLHAQLARRTPAYAVRWDAGLYGDFSLVQAHVFGPVPPFPPPPPYLTALQANGYYDAAGGSLLTRLRLDAGRWSADAEVTGHIAWQIDGADRTTVAPRTSSPAVQIPATPQDTFDGRVFWHISLIYRPAPPWAVAATAEGGYREGRWHALERASSDVAVGLGIQLAL